MGRRYRADGKRPERTDRIVLTVLFAVLMIFTITKPGQQFWYGCMKAAGLAHFTSVLEEDLLHIHVINVGKADAILVESGDTAVLIDTATADKAEDVLHYLSARGIEKLDAVWISHSDDDHAGGLQKLLEEVEIGSVSRSCCSRDPIDAANIQGAAAGSVYDYGVFSLEVLAPLVQLPDENNNSLVLKLRCGEFTMLFCGDAEETAETMLLDCGIHLKADVLKVAHHGSATSTTEAFLDACDPTYAVISVGQDGSELPRNIVLKRFGDRDIPVFRTDELGSVVFSTDGSRIQILTEAVGIVAGGEQE